MKYQTHTLPNGLRIIHEAASTKVVYCGYVVCAGTRHEDAVDAGMAHFIEHMSFKGTARRKSHHIANGLERVGGDLNAFTNKQETVYHAMVLKPDFARAADLLTDIVFRSTYPQHEIDREVEVICDEIESYKDSPSESIFDEFESMIYGAHPLGRDILGNAERLREYVTADAVRFAARHYIPSNAVFFVLGDLPFEKVVRTLEKCTAWQPLRPVIRTQQPLTTYAPTEREVKKDTHQAHVMMGARTFGGNDPRRFALMLLNNILGGPGMNSRLNTSLRERAGLVYSVDAYVNSYPDTGFWNVYFGCDAHDIARCRRLVHKELHRFTDAALTPAALAAAKKQLIGQIGIAGDAFESYSHALGRIFANYNVHRNPEHICAAINEVTAAEMLDVAQTVYDPANLTTLIYR